MRRVIIDTREQRPYSLTHSGQTLESVRRALPSGDYSLEGLEEIVAIERKSADDYVGSVLKNHERFQRELIRLQQFRFAAVVVEISLAGLMAGHYTSKIKPQALLGITCQLMLQYPPVQVIFASDRPHAAQIVAELLVLADRQF